MSCCFDYFCPLDPTEQARRNKERELSRINRNIDAELKNERKKNQNIHRCLLLGCGEAGKSTFIKQMRIIHSAGFPDKEKKELKKDIANNIASAILTLLDKVTFQEEDALMNNDDTYQSYEKVTSCIQMDRETINSDMVAKSTPAEIFELKDDIKTLWESKEIQAVYERRNTFQIVECARYFLNKVQDVCAEEYVPDDQDIVQIRVRTTGIIEHSFEMSGRSTKPRTLILIDVGGQRAERRKWIHSFEDVFMVIFLTEISEYDQVLMEDNQTNRLVESLTLFDTILRSQWFIEKDIVLFLNKKDLLEEKVKSERSPVRDYFAHYDGPNDGSDADCTAAINFFQNEFEMLHPNPEDRKIYSHPTCATDTENIKVVDVVVKNIIFKRILDGGGVL